MGAHSSRRSRGPPTNGAANSPLFECLPPELRRRILIDAFGGRTLHLQSPWHPPCVCRRSENTSPAVDNCQRDRGNVHARGKAEGPGWLIGAMGWLLSCRLAYAEGVEVLYATNTLHVVSKGVVPNPLAPHVPARHFVSVTSLEWVVQPGLWRTDNTYYLRESLNTLRTVLPNLRSVYIGFLSFMGFGVHEASREEKFLVYTERILEPLDMLVDAGFADGLREMEIGVPISAVWEYRMVVGSTLNPRSAPDWIVWAPRSRVWRSVGTRGYWVGETNDDVTDWWIVHCFGT